MPKRFDSTLLMMSCIIRNSAVLQNMLERNDVINEVWPRPLHLSADDFVLIQNVVTILKPVQDVTKSLSLSSAWVGDVLPLITSAIDSVSRMDVT